MWRPWGQMHCLPSSALSGADFQRLCACLHRSFVFTSKIWTISDGWFWLHVVLFFPSCDIQKKDWVKGGQHIPQQQFLQAVEKELREDFPDAPLGHSRRKGQLISQGNNFINIFELYWSFVLSISGGNLCEQDMFWDILTYFDIFWLMYLIKEPSNQVLCTPPSFTRFAEKGPTNPPKRGEWVIHGCFHPSWVKSSSWNIKTIHIELPNV